MRNCCSKLYDTGLQARRKIADRGIKIGIDQEEEVQAIRSLVSAWDDQLEAVQDKSLQYPAYYTRPFHAYDQGNLCWEAAFQVTASTNRNNTLSASSFSRTRQYMQWRHQMLLVASNTLLRYTQACWRQLQDWCPASCTKTWSWLMASNNGTYYCQVPSAAKLVHAAVMDPEGRAMDPNGGESSIAFRV